MLLTVPLCTKVRYPNPSYSLDCVASFTRQQTLITHVSEDHKEFSGQKFYTIKSNLKRRSIPLEPPKECCLQQLPKKDILFLEISPIIVDVKTLNSQMRSNVLQNHIRRTKLGEKLSKSNTPEDDSDTDCRISMVDLAKGNENELVENVNIPWRVSTLDNLSAPPPPLATKTITRRKHPPISVGFAYLERKVKLDQ